MRILCVGLNHKTADVALREKLAFDPARTRHALRQLAEKWPDAEFLLLSTCNRTELYTARPMHGHPRDNELRDWLGRCQSVPPEELADVLYTLSDAAAIGHLFGVAAGMDSLVPGEDQIVGQLKDAYESAKSEGTVRAVINEIVQTTLHVAKHVRTETDIASGKVSVASVAVEFVSRIFETLHGKCVLNIGAGEMNEIMLRQLVELGAERIMVANRSPDRARRLADECDGQAVPFDTLGDHLAECDIVLTSTAAETPILTAAMVESAQKRRDFRPLLIVDIAVPRDVEAGAGQLENVFLYNIDDLDQIVRTTLQMRHGQQEAGQKIIAEHVGEVTDSLSVRSVAPTIDALYRAMQRIAAEELQTARNKLANHDDAEEDAEILQRALHRTIRRILHPCANKLRQAAGTDAARAHIAAVRELFDLDEH